MNRIVQSRHCLSLLAAALLVASAAHAAIVATGTQPIVEPSGAYSGLASFTVYTDDDPANPVPGAPGEFTYVYTIRNDAGSAHGIVGFQLAVPGGGVIDAGWLADADAQTPPPATVSIHSDGSVDWTWSGVAGILDPGIRSEELYVVSAFTPGQLHSSLLSADPAFDLATHCMGPSHDPNATCSLNVVMEGCVIQPDPVPGGACQGRVAAFDFEYTGLGCDASSHLQDPRKSLCIGGADGDEGVDILVTGTKHKRLHPFGWWGSWNRRDDKLVFASFTDVHTGDVLTVDAASVGKNNLSASIAVRISSGPGWHDVVELDRIHTSCSQPFAPGHQFGSIIVTSLTSTEGGDVTLPADPPYEECVSEIDVVEPPHCLGQVESVTLRYTGGDCSQSMHTQDPASATCTDHLAPRKAPVRVVVGDSALGTYVRDRYVSIGDTVQVDASALSQSQLGDTTRFAIKRLWTGNPVTRGTFHTSCSQPLNLGDQFGPLQVVGMTTTNGGSVSFDHAVKYTYEVTNPNDGYAWNVSVDDDLLGPIARWGIIAPGATQVYTKIGNVSEETTNVATVNGIVGRLVCEEATDEATITVAEPPVTSKLCTTAVEAMRLRYTGTETVLDTRVILEATGFPLDNAHLVYHDPVDLIPNVTELTLASENGWSIDAKAHGVVELGTFVNVITPTAIEKVLTGCDLVPFESGKPAPLLEPFGAPSPNWFVVDFTQRD